MPYRALRRFLTSYQRGSIFGAIIVFVAFAAAISTVQRPVNNPPSEKRYAEAEGASRDHQIQQSWWQRATADPVAVFTLLLAVVAIAQAGLFIWQLTYMRAGVSGAKNAADAAKEAADAAVESNKISRDLLISSHRPKLRVRNIVIDRSMGFGANGSFFQVGKLVRGQLYIANVGGTAAHVGESFIGVFWPPGSLPMRRPYEGKDGNDWARGILEAGASKTVLFQSNTVLPQNESVGTSAGSIRLFVMGWIEYKDSLNIQRRTAFCREFQRDPSVLESEGRFVVVDNQDYEHEE